MELITAWVDQYGYIVLFIVLMLEPLGLPLPGEFIMSYCGILAATGQMNLAISFVIAVLGCLTGRTVSYWAGYKLDVPFFQKNGHRFHMGPEKMEKTAWWFRNYGNWVLIIGYFIPGVRHISGYFSGISQMPFSKYAVYAYTGAVIWIGTFVVLGKFLGLQWKLLRSNFDLDAWALVIVLMLIFIFYLYKNIRYKGKYMGK